MKIINNLYSYPSMEHKAQELVNTLRAQLEKKDTQIEQLTVRLEQAQDETDALREPEIDSFHDGL